MKVRVGASTDVGRARERNEDAYLSSPPLYAVADGMGGHRGGNVASSLALRVLSEIAQPGNSEQLSEQVREANRAILEQARSDRTLSGMGTTITAVFMDDGAVHLAHVGDSRAYLLRGGEFQLLTEDHTLVHRMVQEGKISPEEAEHHPQRSILIRALGVEDPVEVDEFPITVQKGDRLLLCSDGLYSMVPDEQIKENLESTPDPQEACVNLVNLANDAGGLDNITVVILDFDDGEGVEVLAPSAGVEQADAGLTRQMRVPTIEPAPGSAGAEPQALPAPAPPAETRPDQGGFTATVSAQPRRTDDTIIATAPEAPSAQLDRFDTAPQRGPRKRRTRRIAVWVVTVVAVLALVGVGLRLYLDSRWFVGTKDGHVAVFRGIPTDLFGTVNLFSLVREFDGIPARQAERLVAYRDLADGHTASSENDAFQIVQTIRTQLADQRRSGAPSP
jgi:serine/threonine protein phosphatase PrpC